MNYNEYDSNGNRRNFDVSDMLRDKKQRARLILLIYLVVIVALVVFVRMSSSSVTNQEKENNQDVIVDNNDKKEENQTPDKIDEMFYLIDQNNYNFTFSIMYQDQQFIIEGKRFGNKYSFSNSDGTNTNYFLGTDTNIKMRTEEGYKTAELPYIYINYFDNLELKNILREATLEDDVYKITNEKLSSLVTLSGNIDNNDDINTFELIIKNNYVVGIVIDCSKALSDYSGEEINATINLSYSNFNLIEDFELAFD